MCQFSISWDAEWMCHPDPIPELKCSLLQLSWVLAADVHSCISMNCPCLPQSSPNPTRRYKSPASLSRLRITLNSHPSSRTTCRITWGLGCNHITINFLPLPHLASLTSLESLIPRTLPNKPSTQNMFSEEPNLRQCSVWPFGPTWHPQKSHIYPSAKGTPRLFYKLHRDVFTDF